MKLLDKLKSIEVYKNDDKLFGIKSAILFGHNKNENSSSPLLYLTKPKHVSQEDYDDIISRINITINNENIR